MAVARARQFFRDYIKVFLNKKFLEFEIKITN